MKDVDGVAGTASFCEGKVAVVTGAGGTLCSCIAKDLALKGAKVVLIGRTREKLEKVAREIEEAQRAGRPLSQCNGQDARCPSEAVYGDLCREHGRAAESWCAGGGRAHDARCAASFCG